MRTALAGVAVAVWAAATAILVSGCSIDAGYPTVHDLPPPRVETTLTPDEVKRVTDNLVSEREHLSTEAQAAQAGAASVSEAVTPLTTGTASPAAARQ